MREGFHLGKKGRLCQIIILVVVLFSAWRIYQVNAAFPAAEKVYVELGEDYLTEENFIVCVHSMRLLDKQQLEERYGEYIGLLEHYDYKGVIAEVGIKNISAEQRKFELYQFYLETDEYFTDGIDMDMYILENQDFSVITLEGGEERIVYLVYSMRENRFSEANWRGMEHTAFYLVRERYPRKVYWKMNTPL